MPTTIKKNADQLLLHNKILVYTIKHRQDCLPNKNTEDRTKCALQQQKDQPTEIILTRGVVCNQIIY